MNTNENCLLKYLINPNELDKLCELLLKTFGKIINI